ncbi:MAG: hypothetical protein ACTSUE_22510 [Promethearchaeota archaeon]
MRVRPRKKSKMAIHRILATFGFLTPMVIFGGVFGYAGYLFETIPEFGMSEDLKPDTSTFLQANYTRLAEMADFYDQRFEDWHIPMGFACTTKFTDSNYNVSAQYEFSDNGALWTGSAMAGYVGKYLAGYREGNTTLINDSLSVISKMVDGMAKMLEVPNGGLGPEYGATVARKFASPDNFNSSHPDYVIGSEELLGNHWKYFNGTGPYINWRWSDFTSNDEYGGYYMGLGLAIKFINGTGPVEVAIHQKLTLMIDQVCAGMLRANFLGISGYGGPTGVDQKMRGFQGATWTLLILKMGAIALPEKYEQLYYHYALEEGYAYFNREGGAQEIVSNYYAYNFGMDVVFALLMLEDSPGLLKLYQENFHEAIWSYIKYHRNPYFNAMYIAINRFAPGVSLDYELDIEDQLMEFDINKFPDVHQAVLPVDATYGTIDLTKWVKFFNETAIGMMIRPLFMSFRLERTYYNKTLTVKMRQTSIFMWDGNPFTPSGSSSETLKEETGLSFTVPYWIARGFCGFIQPSGVRSP